SPPTTQERRRSPRTEESRRIPRRRTTWGESCAITVWRASTPRRRASTRRSLATAPSRTPIFRRAVARNRRLPDTSPQQLADLSERLRVRAAEKLENHSLRRGDDRARLTGLRQPEVHVRHAARTDRVGDDRDARSAREQVERGEEHAHVRLDP